MSPYDNPLGGRLQYDDDDQDGQVHTLQDSSEYVACRAGTLRAFYTIHGHVGSARFLPIHCCTMVQDHEQSDADTRVRSRNIRWAAAAMAAMLLISGM